MFDMVEELAAIHRTVAIDSAAETVSVSVSRTYTAEIEDVWDALTNPERLPRWFAPVSGDLWQGGNFQIEGNPSGDILTCDRPSLLRVTFGMPDSIVEVRLTGSGESTTVELFHSVPLAIAGSGAGALFVGTGWDGALLGLSLHFDGQEFEPQVFGNSPEVVEFNKGSIAGWTEAIAASGTATSDEIAGAREAAIAQYTIVP